MTVIGRIQPFSGVSSRDRRDGSDDEPSKAVNWPPAKARMSSCSPTNSQGSLEPSAEDQAGWAPSFEESTVWSAGGACTSTGTPKSVISIVISILPPSALNARAVDRDLQVDGAVDDPFLEGCRLPELPTLREMGRPGGRPILSTCLRVGL
jgi:hypothetical protein